MKNKGHKMLTPERIALLVLGLIVMVWAFIVYIKDSKESFAPVGATETVSEGSNPTPSKSQNPSASKKKKKDKAKNKKKDKKKTKKKEVPPKRNHLEEPVMGD